MISPLVAVSCLSSHFFICAKPAPPKRNTKKATNAHHIYISKFSRGKLKKKTGDINFDSILLNAVYPDYCHFNI